MTITIDLAFIIAFITIVSAIGGVFAFVYKILHRVENALERINAHGDDIKVIMRCSQVSLNGLVQLGANGIVKETRDEMEKYLIAREAVR